MKAFLYRVGLRGGYISHVRDPDIKVRSGNYHGRGSGITFSARLPSKGGGETKVYLHISEDSFSELAGAMMEKSSEHAERAFLEAMLKQRK